MDIISNSNIYTQQLGELISKNAFSGMIIALKGEMGCGKTEFTKGFTKGANSDIATSPTFAIMNVYENGKLPIYHFDFYRIGNQTEEFEEFIYGDGVAIIEWSELVNLPDDILVISFKKIDDNKRKITFEAKSEKYKKVFEGVQLN